MKPALITQTINIIQVKNIYGLEVTLKKEKKLRKL